MNTRLTILTMAMGFGLTACSSSDSNSCYDRANDQQAYNDGFHHLQTMGSVGIVPLDAAAVSLMQRGGWFQEHP